MTTTTQDTPSNQSVYSFTALDIFNPHCINQERPTVHPYHEHSHRMADAKPFLPAVDSARRSDTLRFHTSPPPSLTARFAMGNGNPQSVSMTGEDDPRSSQDSARTLPGELRDPKGTLQRVRLPTTPNPKTSSDDSLSTI